MRSVLKQQIFIHCKLKYVLEFFFAIHCCSLSITLLVINEGGLLKNDTFDETSIPSFEQVIKYVQRLCFVYTE